MIIDGVVNSHDWFAGVQSHKSSRSNTKQYTTGNDTSTLLDTDSALASIYDACVEARPSLCAIYKNSADLIRARVDKLINDVHIAPVPLFAVEL